MVPIQIPGLTNPTITKGSRMSVTDFECAIAKSQIARYIAGENLAPEVSRHLESHIAVCPRCKQLLQEKKNSLEAIIKDNHSAESAQEIAIPSDRIPMTRQPAPTVGNLAMNLESSEPMSSSAPEVDEPRMTLREKLREQARLLAAKSDDNVIEIPTVAPAFAHQEVANEKIRIVSDAAAEAPKKKGLSLSSFALYRKVPDEPKLTVENVKSAREAIKTNQGGFAKPMLYMAGLCAVIGGMSYFTKNPTAMFGGRANTKQAVHTSGEVAKTTPKGVKRLPIRSEGTTNAEFFTSGSEPKATKAPAKPVTKKPAIKPVTKAKIDPEESTATSTKEAPAPTPVKTAKAPVKKPVAGSTKTPVKAKPVVKKPVAKKPAAKLLSKPVVTKTSSHHKAAHSATTKRAPKATKAKKVQSEVKLYAPDSK